jgi:P27 family predicted phage terminase small subunit
MGRRALPANVHQLRGNPSKLPAATLDAQAFIDVEIPACPNHLKDEAAKEWRRISRELEKVKLITKLDRGALAAYCVNWARWVYSERKLAELGDLGLVESTPSGYRQMGVWLQVSHRAQDQMHKFMREFGLTPSARASLNIAAAQQASLFPETDPMAALLHAGGHA